MVSTVGEVEAERTRTYEMGDSGVVVSGHDLDGGWRRERKKSGETGHRGGDSVQVVRRA